MATQIGHGLGSQGSSPVVDKRQAEKQEKTEKMRNSQEYQAMLKENIDWLTQLDATDSKPNNGRVDISVFNAKVAKFGYEPECETEWFRGLPRNKSDVDIQKQAQSMADKYYAKKFGL